MELICRRERDKQAKFSAYLKTLLTQKQEEFTRKQKAILEQEKKAQEKLRVMEKIKQRQQENMRKKNQSKHELTKERVEKFQHERRICTQNKKRIRENAELRRKQKRKMHLEKQKPKIESRQRKAKSKVVENLKVKRVEKQLREQRKILLANAVEKYACRPNPERDFARVIQDTKSKINRDRAKKVEELFQVQSHNNEQLMQNLNFRLQVYLYEKGVLGSPFAHRLVNNLDGRSENPLY